MRNTVLFLGIHLCSGLATPDILSAQSSCAEFNGLRPAEQLLFVNGALAGLGAAAHVTNDIAHRLVAMQPPEKQAIPDTMATVADLLRLPPHYQVTVAYHGAVANVGERTIGEFLNRIRALCARPGSVEHATAKIIAEVVGEIMTLEAWGRP